MGDQHEIAAGMVLFVQQGWAIEVVGWLADTLDKREAEAVWETHSATLGHHWDEPKGPGWQPFAVDDGVMHWRRRVPRG